MTSLRGKMFQIIALLMGPTLLLGACSLQKNYKSYKKINAEEASKPPTAELTDPSSSHLGIRDFRRLEATFAAETGFGLSQKNVKDEYLRQLDSLPRSSLAGQLTSSNVAAATMLASQHCSAMLTQGSGSTNMVNKFPGLNISEIPSDSVAYAKIILQGLYGEPTALQGDRTKDIEAVANSIAELKKLNASGPVIFTALCTGILASAPFIFY